MKRFLFSLIPFLLIAAAAHSASAQVIRLRPSAVVAGPNVEVGDIATMEGLDKKTWDHLAHLVVFPALQSEVAIKPETLLSVVLADLEDHDLAMKVQWRGAAECAVTREGTTPAAKPAMKTSDLSAAPTTVVTLQGNAALGTQAAVTAARSEVATTDAGPGKGKLESLASLLTAEVLKQSKCVPGDIDIQFENRDSTMNEALKSNQRWVFHTSSRGSLGMLQWNAQLFEGPKLLQGLHVQAMVKRRVNVVVALAAIDKLKMVTPELVKTEDRWLDREMPSYIKSIDDVVGQQAARNVAYGEVLDTRDFKAQPIVATGEIITIYIYSGSIKIKSSGKAMKAGCLHDTLSFRNESNGQQFSAVVIGKGVALVGRVDAETEKALREIQ